MNRTTPFPFGKNWTCVTCGNDYPEDFPGLTCPIDDGHLHRIAATRTPLDPAKKLEYVREVHKGEQQSDGRFLVKIDD